uniref:recombinase family protein n=1 Tax=Oceanobacillus sp. FSL W7-1281 TaxID=2921698 RepID=UPI00403F5E3F
MLQQLIKSIHANEFSHVLVYRYDRISRNMKVNIEFQHELKNHDVTLISLRERFDFYG